MIGIIFLLPSFSRGQSNRMIWNLKWNLKWKREYLTRFFLFVLHFREIFRLIFLLILWSLLISIYIYNYFVNLGINFVFGPHSIFPPFSRVNNYQSERHKAHRQHLITLICYWSRNPLSAEIYTFRLTFVKN